MQKKVLHFYHFCIFQHFDGKNKFVLLNLVAFRLLHLNILHLSFSLNHNCCFFLFFVSRFFKYICVTILSSSEQSTFSERKFYLWLIHDSSPLCKLDENNWSKSKNNSDVHRISKNCLLMNMSSWKCLLTDFTSLLKLWFFENICKLLLHWLFSHLFDYYST